MSGEVARDPGWLAHRYEEGTDRIHFLHLPRREHRKLTFLTEEYIAADTPRVVLPRAEAIAAAPPPAPVHFIFHSAFCCSTLLARAVDREGVAMGLKEPVILNDMVGWRRRGAEPRQLGAVLDNALTLLARPFAPGEAVVVKPSNILNGIAPVLLGMRPDARALLLHAPLRVFLSSVAKKGMWGRLWVRELFAGYLKDGFVDLGFDAEAHFRQTDLQIAAMGWLAQHAGFARLVERFGPERVSTLNSEELTECPAEAVAALFALFRLPLGDGEAGEIANGPAFTRHSKFDTTFSSAERVAEQQEATALHADEIDKVAAWAEAVAASAGVEMVLGAPLLR